MLRKLFEEHRVAELLENSKHTIVPLRQRKPEDTFHSELAEWEEVPNIDAAIPNEQWPSFSGTPTPTETPLKSFVHSALMTPFTTLNPTQTSDASGHTVSHRSQSVTRFLHKPNKISVNCFVILH